MQESQKQGLEPHYKLTVGSFKISLPVDVKTQAKFIFSTEIAKKVMLCLHGNPSFFSKCPSMIGVRTFLEFSVQTKVAETLEEQKNLGK